MQAHKQTSLLAYSLTRLLAYLLKKMIIGVDASKASEDQKTGLGNTLYPILLELQKIDKINQYYLYTNSPLPKELLSDNFIEKLIPSFKFWHSIKLPFTLRKDKPDKFLSFTNPAPMFAPKNTIVLIHDFAFKYFPECYGYLGKNEQDRAVKLAIKNNYKIVVTSEANKNDLKKFYPNITNEIFVTLLGFNQNIVDDTKEIEKLAKINDPFFLSVGRIEKRKNTQNIILAFSQFKTETKSAAKLILVGKNGYGSKEVTGILNSMPEEVQKDIFILGFVSDQALAWLYSKALALVFPSLYEGFGFPILEAQKSGVPVITSNIPTIVEVTKDSALLINPKKIEEISTAMVILYKDQEKRIGLISAGKENIKRFSWNKTAKKILAIINIK